MIDIEKETQFSALIRECVFSQDESVYFNLFKRKSIDYRSSKKEREMVKQGRKRRANRSTREFKTKAERRIVAEVKGKGKYLIRERN